jgi:hypothetical protein
MQEVMTLNRTPEIIHPQPNLEFDSIIAADFALSALDALVAMNKQFTVLGEGRNDGLESKVGEASLTDKQLNAVLAPSAHFTTMVEAQQVIVTGLAPEHIGFIESMKNLKIDNLSDKDGDKEKDPEDGAKPKAFTAKSLHSTGKRKGLFALIA